MSDKSAIEWTDATWSVTRGCTRVSRGCGGAGGGGCYAERMAHRFSGPGMPYEGLTRMTSGGPRWTGKVCVVPEALDLPLHWRKPRRIFVNSMSDLFHPDVPFHFAREVLSRIMSTPRHTYQVLTKRPERMREFFTDYVADWPILQNLWLGTSVEDQASADARIPHLLATSAAVRFLSCEPLLGPVKIPYLSELVDWVIAGSESGPGARPVDEDWVRSLRDQCVGAGVGFFYKQRLDGRRKVSTPELDGRTWTEMPAAMERRREP